MTPTTKTPAEIAMDQANASMPDIPAGLRRKPPVPGASERIAKAHNATVESLKASTAAKAAPAAKPTPAQVKAALKAQADNQPAHHKPAKAKPAPKAAKPAVEHKPSTIVPTAANPSKSIVPSRFKAAYKPHNDTNGSPLNLYLKEHTTARNEEGRESLDLVALAKVAADNGIDFQAYAHLNNGQKRMNVGNKLAGLLKSGKKVTIGSKVFADATKALRKPEPAQTAA